MKVRGERECGECGARWSYYETGSVACPTCGGLRSVGVGERKHHTDSGASLDLSAARQAAADRPMRRAARKAADACRSYVHARGFVSGGTLLALDDVYVAAQELKHAASEASTRLDLTDDEEHYLLTLLRGAEDGERPSADAVPDPFRSARGLGAAAAVQEYRTDLREYVAGAESGAGDYSVPNDAPRFVERLGEHEKRVQALDGDVAPDTADALVATANAVGEYVRTGEAGVRAAAETALSNLA